MMRHVGIGWGHALRQSWMFALLLTAGCLGPARVDLGPRTGGSAALVGQFRAYDGRTGQPLTFGQVVARCRQADAILFGEEHNDAVCNQLEAQLLYALVREPRPVALAMEFFEADTQAALDAYLRGRIDEEPFRTETRQGRGYVLSHRPLIELCRLMNVPVVAANAPRKLVRAYRTSGLSYEDFRAGLTPAEQRWVPLENSYVTGGYEQRFREIMSGHGGPPAATQPASAPATQLTSSPATHPSTADGAPPPGMPPADVPPTMPSSPPTMPASMPPMPPASMPHVPPASMPAAAPTTAPASQPAGPSRTDPASMYQSQLLWDQSMAEALASFRARHPAQRIMLIVGVFHVAHDGGTAVKYRRLRPSDRVLTVAYRSTTDGRLPFESDDRGAGDIIVYGITPPPEPKREAPASAPATTTQPTAEPTTQPATPEAAARDTETTPAPSPAAPPEAAAPPPPRREIAIREVLAIGGVGRWGRSAVHTDAIEADIVAGSWAAPAAGQWLTLPDGSARTWVAVSAEEDGAVRHESLAGGYAHAAIEAEQEEVLLLEASGHSMVYANGEPRAGDPYQWGFVRLPVLLKRGINEFLFACGRGELRAKLVEPASPVMLDASDATLPDLLVGEEPNTWAAVVVINATTEPSGDADLHVRYRGEERVTRVPSVPALTVRKVGVPIVGREPDGPQDGQVQLTLVRRGAALSQAELPLRVRQPTETYKRTFVSEIDGSVQYYAVTPMCGPAADDASGKPALFLSLHGAGVEALGQASCYTSKTWGHVVAPTNRRPYGFDWEDWGRVDALEVLTDAERRFGTDPRRTYLTGHSMGGHGTWQIGAHYPDRFAAIAPSASWISFWSYVGGERPEPDTPVETILRRATNPSDTLGLSRNYRHHGIYILHGDQDDNVPVAQARTMREHLAGYHGNFAYYERPGAGHWWGNECMDWPPLFEFLSQNTRPATVQHVEFVTASPVISATCHWATIEAQTRGLDFSRIDLRWEPQERLLRGTTENVARLAITLGAARNRDRAEAADLALPPLEPGQPVSLELDNDRLESVPWPAADGVLRLARQDGHWQVLAGAPDLAAKGPHRGGPFKEAFGHRVQLVYGTRGSAEESAWARAKARYDAEVFWVRGNGAFDVVADVDFDPFDEPDRNVVLYGNADTNAVWAALLADCPIQVHSGTVKLADEVLSGVDLAVLAVYPRPGSDRTLVGIVSGTGLPGLRLTERLPYFVSGVAYPDWIVIGPEMLQAGIGGVRAAGFFGNNWLMDPEQSGVREVREAAPASGL